MEVRNRFDTSKPKKNPFAVVDTGGSQQNNPICDDLGLLISWENLAGRTVGGVEKGDNEAS
jgi:hypothetical protein